MAEYAGLLMFVAAFGFLLLGYPVAITLAGTALLAAGIGIMTGDFNQALLSATPNRLFGIMTNQTLMAVPLFILMGVILERSQDRRTTTGDHEQVVRSLTRRLGHRRHRCGYVDGREHGHRRRHSRDDGLDGAAQHAQGKL